MTARLWSDAERRRFEQLIVEALQDEGATGDPLHGTIRVLLGSGAAGGACVVTWASRATGKLTQHRALLSPAAVASILRRTSDKLDAPADAEA